MEKDIKKNKKNLKLVAATAMTVFSLIAVFVATFAWFSLNHNVDANGMAIKVKSSGNAFTSLTVHRCIINESSETVYKFDSTPSINVGSQGNVPSSSVPPSSQTIFDVDDYSSLNRSQPVLLLLRFKSGTKSSDISITASTEIDYDTYANAGGENKFQVNASTVKNYPLSFACHFMSGEFSSEIFNFSVSTSSIPQQSQFVTMANNSITGLSSPITLFQGSGDTSVRCVAIVMNYYELAIEFLHSINMANDYIKSNGNKIDYYSDWSMNVTANVENQSLSSSSPLSFSSN